VSKLVAIHDESRPLYDRHVRNFFGIWKPGIGSTDFQISGFIKNLSLIQQEYQSWSSDDDFKIILNCAQNKIPELKKCHENRICDFLVWTAGRNKLGNEKSVNEV
jgi:hypothetical protein